MTNKLWILKNFTGNRRGLIETLRRNLPPESDEINEKKNLSKDSQSPSRNSNQTPSKYKCTASVSDHSTSRHIISGSVPR
jgi:hypothetical protein